MTSIDIVTKVVDNYGDAGVALRLLRSLASIEREMKIRLFIDHPEVLGKLLGGEWEFNGPGSILLLREMGNRNNEPLSVGIYNWSELPDEKTDNRPDLLIEMFAGGLPDNYLEQIYGGFPPREPKTLWLNLEYLTAEEWASDYHLTPSYSPDESLERVFFMPGFRKELGGLIVDRAFFLEKSYWDGLAGEGKADARMALIDSWGLTTRKENGKGFWISIFSYDRDFSGLVEQLNDTPEAVLLLSPGKGTEKLKSLYLKEFPDGGLIELPFLHQREWDKLLLACDINFVRGEESLSRAALAGRPFLWQAYPLAEEEHLEKVAALCSLIFPEKDDLKELFLQYNRGKGDDHFALLWQNYHAVKPIFEGFAKNLEKNGNCTQKILQFFDTHILEKKRNTKWF